MPPTWTTLRDLRPGALFVTRDGIIALKTEYHTFGRTQCDCYLTASGESAHFPDGDDEEVRELPLPASYDLGVDPESTATTPGTDPLAEKNREFAEQYEAATFAERWGGGNAAWNRTAWDRIQERYAQIAADEVNRNRTAELERLAEEAWKAMASDWFNTSAGTEREWAAREAFLLAESFLEERERRRAKADSRESSCTEDRS